MASWLPAIFIGAFVAACIVGVAAAVHKLVARGFWNLLPAPAWPTTSKLKTEKSPTPAEGGIYDDDAYLEQYIVEAMQSHSGPIKIPSLSRLNTPRIVCLAALGVTVMVAAFQVSKTLWTSAETPEEEFADSLTRSACWSYRSITSDFRLTLCFLNPPRVTMTNYTMTTDHKKWTICDWSGDYSRNGNRMKITFQENSRKCSNGAPSPRQTMECDYTGHSVECRGTRIVDGKSYEIDDVLR